MTISTAQRAMDGCTVTFENADGLRIVVARTNVGPRIGLGEACDIALRHDPSFRVICYSTPPTILADLIGGREKELAGVYELQALSAIGRRDMLHPRIVSAIEGRRRPITSLRIR